MVKPIYPASGGKNKLSVVNNNTAGIDIGSRKIFIALADKTVVSFGTFTDDFLQAVTYLKQNNISSVAMEATGVYWISLYDILDQSGFDVFLVKSSQAKAIPGRKTDVADCQWIQQLHSFGLLRASFIPPQHIRTLRAFVRQRRVNLQLASDHIRRAHKALELMNIKLQNVITQINGKSGLAVLSAIVNGNHDPILLASLCEDSILKKKKDAVIRSLKGNFSQENIFLLKQALDAYLFYMKQVDDCDKQIEKHLSLITSHLPSPKKLNKPKPIRHHKPNIDELHLKLMKLTNGKDPSQITGLTDSTLLQVISEVGADLSRFPTEKHFTSWLGLAPNSHQSGLTNKKKKFKRHTSAGQFTLDNLLLQLDQIRDHLNNVLKQLREESKIENIASVISSLCSVPGVAFITAMSLFTEIIDIKRFNNFEQLCSFIGLVPSVYASGDTEFTRGISFRHNKFLRPLIIEAAWTAVKKDPALTLRFNELIKQMPKQKAIIRIAKKLLRRIRHVWLYQDSYVNALVA